jgi:hypothetical protein
MIVYQYDQAGILLHATQADESPLEPGKFLIPARCTATPPPTEIPEGQVPRWNGAEWTLVRMPTRAEAQDPVAKLQAFLAANPDVAELIQPD